MGAHPCAFARVGGDTADISRRYDGWSASLLCAHHLHFVTWSCYRRQPLLRSARSRDCLVDILEQARGKYRFVVVGYVVMPEHGICL